MQDLIDKTDHCRACGGRGYFKEKTQRDTWLYDDCRDCRGSGCRTVRIEKKAGAA
jgi:DnaJ-class molecular chaperone